MELNIFFGIINIAIALLLIGISISLVKRKIKMNRLYDIRINKSFKSEYYWYKIYEYGGKQLIVWSLPMIFIGIIGFFVPIYDSNKDILSLVFGVLPITLCITGAVIMYMRICKNNIRN